MSKRFSVGPKKRVGRVTGNKQLFFKPNYNFYWFRVAHDVVSARFPARFL